MSYKDREQYLGFSEKLGYLDKGGQWRKKDWYNSKKDDGGAEAEARKDKLKQERLEAKR